MHVFQVCCYIEADKNHECTCPPVDVSNCYAIVWVELVNDHWESVNDIWLGYGL